MSKRLLATFLLSSSIFAALSSAQDKPAATPAEGTVAAVVQREAKDLSADAFAQRDAALKRLQTLVADQLKQRAQIQDVLNAFQADLVQQQQALAIVSDEEAQAQIAGLLEMERGLTGWTIQAMSEPAERRKELLAWGLTSEKGPTLARVYSDKLRIRLDGIKQLAKINDPGALWTLARLVNDRETPVRAAAMAACWNSPPNADIVNALWFRAVTGPLSTGEASGSREGRMMAEGRMGAGNSSVKVDFPGGDPMEFDDSNEGNEFFDSQLASYVLVHFNAPLVADKVKALVEERAKAGKTLSLNSDPDWTLVSHRLVEAYGIKEAIPLLASEALGAESEDMGVDMNGRTYMWSQRTMAIGALCKLIGKDPADLNLSRAHDTSDAREWSWAVEVNQQAMMNGNPQSDGPAVRAFYAFWKDHHAEYGVKETPSDASVPPVPVPGQAVPVPRRFRGQPVPADVQGGVIVPPGEGGDAPATTAPATAPASAPANAGAAG